MFIEWKNIKKNLGEFNLDLNLKINNGELITLLGPSGCGKTTALRIAAGFIQQDEGDFIINDENLNKIPSSKRNIGIVFQNYALFPHLNVEQNIGYGLKKKLYDKKKINYEIDSILNSLKLNNYNKRSIDSLSGGEKQRVALGRSLAIKPRLLLLDEPLSALDADLRKQLRLEIKKIQREFGITTLYVTHDQEEALSISDRIALMNKGKIQQIDTPEDIYNKPVNLFVANFIGESNIIQQNSKHIFFRPENVEHGHCKDSYNFEGEVINKEFQGHFSRGLLKTKCNNNIKIISKENIYFNKYHIKISNTIEIKTP